MQCSGGKIHSSYIEGRGVGSNVDDVTSSRLYEERRFVLTDTGKWILRLGANASEVIRAMQTIHAHGQTSFYIHLFVFSIESQRYDLKVFEWDGKNSVSKNKIPKKTLLLKKIITVTLWKILIMLQCSLISESFQRNEKRTGCFWNIRCDYVIKAAWQQRQCST